MRALLGSFRCCAFGGSRPVKPAEADATPRPAPRGRSVERHFLRGAAATQACADALDDWSWLGAGSTDRRADSPSSTRCLFLVQNIRQKASAFCRGRDIWRTLKDNIFRRELAPGGIFQPWRGSGCRLEVVSPCSIPSSYKILCEPNRPNHSVMSELSAKYGGFEWSVIIIGISSRLSSEGADACHMGEQSEWGHRAAQASGGISDRRPQPAGPAPPAWRLHFPPAASQSVRHSPVVAQWPAQPRHIPACSRPACRPARFPRDR